MGCGASTAAAAVQSQDLESPKEQGGFSDTTKKPSDASLSQKDNANKHPKHNFVLPKTPSDRRKDWGVRPGYSSGASSYSGSEAGDAVSESEVYELTKTRDAALDRSMHSDVCALGNLRQEIVDAGDLTQKVVRIETPFGIPIEEIYDGVQEGPVLGSGVSGIVRLISHRATGLKYAVKILDLGLIDSTEGLRQLRDEIFIMCQLDHPNIVRIEEVYESTNEIYIVQELCLGGDLFDRLDEQPDFHYTEPQCARLVKQMLSSIRYLHSKGIIHRDLKLENFLFSSTAADSDLKMIDFGLSKHFELGQLHTEKVGTPYTVAPEIIRGHYDEKSDIWALGVITYLLLCGETPFGGLDGENLLMVKQQILRAQVSFEPEDIWENVSDDAKQFVKRMLHPDPKLRPTAREAQQSQWIQVWAKKNAKEGAKLKTKTVSALMAFKECSDMQKLLSEVLSFTLLPEQIVDLKSEFEKIDTDGDGEISLIAMKQVLMQNAEAGALGGLTEQEIEDIFDAIRTRKSDAKIRWHEFLAAGLSQAKIDDRNLRLAFDRLDTDRKGFVTFDDLHDLVGSGSTAESEALETIWRDSMLECKAHLDRITFNDFKRLMKGQPKEKHVQGSGVDLMLNASQSKSSKSLLEAVPEKVERAVSMGQEDLSALIEESEVTDAAMRARYGKKRSRSFEQKGTVWDASSSSVDMDSIPMPTVLDRDASRALILPGRADESHEEVIRDKTMSPLLVNRALYRKHREMRIAVLEASKQFDVKRKERHESGYPTKASLIMRRGAKPPLELEDQHQRAMFEAAAKRCGRSKRSRNKTVSDVTGMILKAAT